MTDSHTHTHTHTLEVYNAEQVPLISLAAYENNIINRDRIIPADLVIRAHTRSCRCLLLNTGTTYTRAPPHVYRVDQIPGSMFCCRRWEMRGCR